ncbi:MAG TPA: hypothetical protein VK186_06720, partial [Candidatus Deferrimicrobium sp.]|nr:hypothetical protein [Candidatus Deferrimicrobium sp.]
EIRNSKQIPMTKKINDRNKNHRSLSLDDPEGTAFVWNFELLNFEFVSNFVLRASDLLLLRAPNVGLT